MVILRSTGGTVSLVRENDTAKPLAFRYWAYWSAIFQSGRDPTAIISIDFPVGSLLANWSPIVTSKSSFCGPMMLRTFVPPLWSFVLLVLILGALFVFILAATQPPRKYGTEFFGYGPSPAPNGPCIRKSKATTRAALLRTLQDANRLIFPILPAVVAPIAAPWMFAEGDAGTGPPVIVVNDHTRTRRIIVPLVNVPANIAVADDGCRRCHH